MTNPSQGKMNFHKRHTLRGYRIRIYTVQHSQSILFVIDEAFLDSQTRRMNLLPRPIRCWNRWRDKHHCDLLNDRKIEVGGKGFISFLLLMRCCDDVDDVEAKQDEV